MAAALDGLPDTRVYARDPGPHAGGVRVPPRALSRAARAGLAAVPGLRARDDWAALLYDDDFDAVMARLLEPVCLFDGVMGQCVKTAAVARRRGAATIVTSLNTHIDHLVEALDRERARIGGAARSFVHPEAARRARRQIAEADWIRVNSAHAARSFVRRGADPSRVRVIHPAVDLTHFTPQPLAEGRSLQVLAVGSIDMRKGPHYLLEAFAEARLPGARLEIIGGTGSRWARRLIARYIGSGIALVVRHVDVGTVPASETYGRASVLVHAAIEDGWGLVVPQALACGRPVVVTSASGAAELVTDGVDGFVVPPASPAAIRDRLELLQSDPALLARMSAAAPRAVAGLGYGAFARDVRAFYEEAAA